MHFAKLSAFLALPLLAVATPWGSPTTSKEATTTVTVTTTATATEPASQCNTGPIQCCNSVQKADSPAASSLLGLLGVVVQSGDALVGINCSPISAIGVGGNSCNADPVCCENNNYNGLIVIGCVPININL